MKKKVFLVMMPVMALVFGFVFTACPTDDDDKGGGDNEGGSTITLSVRNGGWSRPITQVVVHPRGSVLSGEALCDTGHMSLNITNGRTEPFSVDLKGNSHITIRIYYYAYTTGDLIGSASENVENTAPGKKYVATLSSGRYMTVTEE
jgi:hypothetical protein